MEKKFETYPEISSEEIRSALDFACRQILHVLPEFTDKFQQAYSENGFYPPVENRDWTTGFWTGEIWLAYEFCGDERLKKAGEIQVHDFLERIDKKISVDHHDMGFLYSPSCVAAYKLIGSKEGREAAIKAADQLITRYHAKGEFIQAWGAMDEPGNYRLIIDCLLNLPLLYWASGETGDNKYRDIAAKLMKSVYDNYAVKDFETSNGLVLHSTYSNHSPYNTCDHKGVDECNAWGDYFYMEALTRMHKKWELYW